MIVKFCGMQRKEDIDAVNEIKPDLAGFILVPGRRRYVEPKTLEELKAELDPAIRAVGVFIDEEISVVTDLLKRGIIDIAQLHGNESSEYIRELKKTTGAKVIKAIGIHDDSDLQKVEECEADMVLLDSPGGGTGETFNWRRLQEVKRPFILAGGLNTENIEEAIRTIHPYGVDVSSGIETDGKKDAEKMRSFMEIARKG
ncbi:MAG: phosphoribosylanthranilate isomerase [Clostridiales bacterium]|nr:phosphoribosylanthranilate isomerase [Clostridiales bacterium]